MSLQPFCKSDDNGSLVLFKDLIPFFGGKPATVVLFKICLTNSYLVFLSMHICYITDPLSFQIMEIGSSGVSHISQTVRMVIYNSASRIIFLQKARVNKAWYQCVNFEY